MAADLHIHVLEGITEDDIRIFNSNTVGSKYFNPRTSNMMEAFDRVGSTPQVWIGEVSWLKAALVENLAKFVPNSVQRVSELIGEDLPAIDETLIGEIEKAMTLENKTTYSLAKPGEVVAFLRQHMGKRVFTVSW